MDTWFLSKDGWNACNGDYIDRQCYPNSYGRGVHIWGSKPLAGEPVVVAGFATTFGRLQICEMFEFLKHLYSKDPCKKEWILSSCVITTQGSLNPSGMTTRNLDEVIRCQRRSRCRVMGKLAVDRGELQGNNWSALHCAHVFPLGWSVESKMQQMFSTEAFQVIKKLCLHVKDSSVNTMLMDARAHAWFDDYRFGIWPVQEDSKWYGKLFRFEQSRYDVDGLWPLAA
ncbi:hypothetical protein DFH06DRAFT_1174645, partial [Mycena polygramma]